MYMLVYRCICKYMIVFVCTCTYVNEHLLILAETPQEIDAIRDLKLKVVVPDDDGAFITQEVQYISPEVRAMVDNMCFLGAYGHKTMFESERTRQSESFRAGFAKYALTQAIERIDNFHSSWKDYKTRNPVQATGPSRAATGDVDIDATMGGDTDDDAPVFPAAAVPAAAPAAAPAPAAGKSD
jgi:hypothetical protein